MVKNPLDLQTDRRVSRDQDDGVLNFGHFEIFIRYFSFQARNGHPDAMQCVIWPVRGAA